MRPVTVHPSLSSSHLTDLITPPPPQFSPPHHHNHSVGPNLEQLINRPDERYCFRYMDQRVYYVRCARTQHCR